MEHRDRLLRLGSEYIYASLAAQNRKLIISDQAELQEMVGMLTSFCARLYWPQIRQ